MKTIVILSLTVIFCTLQGSAQFLWKNTSSIDFSGISTEKERVNFKNSFYYRQRYDGDGSEKTRYNIFSIYKQDSTMGFCPYGIEIDPMHEHFEKTQANTFRYWNKIRLGIKVLIEENIYQQEKKMFVDCLDGELYFSYLHLPHTARGDLSTKSRKGAVTIFVRTTATKKVLAYMKYDFESIGIKTYYKYQNYVSYSGLYVEIYINKKGYTHSLVQSSHDTYKGLVLFGGPEYNLTSNKISINVGIKYTKANH